jgi:hypothetical protein
VARRQASAPARRRPSAPSRGRSSSSWASAPSTLAGFLAFRPIRTTPYLLSLWGASSSEGRLPSFEAYRAPTQHPLAVAFGRRAVPGRGSRLLIVGATTSRSSRSSRPVRWGARRSPARRSWRRSALHALRLPFLAARATSTSLPRADLWPRRSRRSAARGTPALLLLAPRPAAPRRVIIAGLYVLWCARAEGCRSGSATPPWRRSRRSRGPPWTCGDGRPALLPDPHERWPRSSGGRRGPSEGPAAVVRFLLGLDKPPSSPRRSRAPCSRCSCAARGGVPVALFLVDRDVRAHRARRPVDRLPLPAHLRLMVMLFAAVSWAASRCCPARSRARGGPGPWRPPRAARRPGYTATHTTPPRSRRSCASAATPSARCGAPGGAGGAGGDALRARLRAQPQARPEGPWVLGAGPAAVPARSDRSQRRRIAAAWRSTPRTATRCGGRLLPRLPAPGRPMAGFERIATNSFYAAYARC